jgi:hypothetical protein
MQYRPESAGENGEQKTLDDLSDELQVTTQTPPTCRYHTTNDNRVGVENSVQFYLALRKPTPGRDAFV